MTQVRVLGVPVSEIDMIEPPRSSDVRHYVGVQGRQGARGHAGRDHVAEFERRRADPAHPGVYRQAVLPDSGRIDLDRTAVPVGWDEVKGARGWPPT